MRVKAKVLLVICILLFILTILCMIGDIKSHYYEYVDYNGNRGTSESCGSNKGNLICVSGDTVIKVVEFTKKER